MDASDFKELMKEAHILGIHYTGSDTQELVKLIELARKNKGEGHPVPCYGVSHDPTDRRCRVCQLRVACSRLDTSPRVEKLDVTVLQSLPCEACGKGSLEIELLDLETHRLKDYACSTLGCQNMISIQCGWSAERLPTEHEIVLGDPEKKVEKISKEKSLKKEKNVKEKKISVKNKVKKPRVVIKKAAEDCIKKKVVARSKRKALVIKKGQDENLQGGKHFQYEYNGFLYATITTVINEITQSKNWSPQKFFGVRLKEIRLGDEYTRTWRNKTYKVTVVKG
jgi:hypothetical protein